MWLLRITSVNQEPNPSQLYKGRAIDEIAKKACVAAEIVIKPWITKQVGTSGRSSNEYLLCKIRRVGLGGVGTKLQRRREKVGTSFRLSLKNRGK